MTNYAYNLKFIMANSPHLNTKYENGKPTYKETWKWRIT